MLQGERGARRAARGQIAVGAGRLTVSRVSGTRRVDRKFALDGRC